MSGVMRLCLGGAKDRSTGTRWLGLYRRYQPDRLHYQDLIEKKPGAGGATGFFLLDDNGRA